MQPMVRSVAGWRRFEGASGIVLRLQLFEGHEAFEQRRLDRVDLSLDDRQLRSLARDLVRAVEQRGMALHDKRAWWQLWKARHKA
ncbi:hypothetical protein [Sphingomonas sp. 37zxx]|uniref:hypothetical protein n=1 Tax=Sphingomonas sp. 37zxx TaxID=1550073 RepID=UPI0012E02C91|nr:hypothetical protein [Sphingomonas sp. 37zxx]